MILIAGGTGTLGTRLLPRLYGHGVRVRVLTRHPERARHLENDQVELFAGDLRDSQAVSRAVAGVTTVISAAQGGFGATDGATPRSVDGLGNSNLIAAAKAEGVEHFILLSIIDAAADHPVELWREKHRAEQSLKASGVPWTIVAPAAFMDWALTQFGDPLIATGRTTVFGRGNMPINFVSAADVAAIVDRAVVDPGIRGRRIPLAGPENMTLNQVVRAVQDTRHKTASVRHVPLPAMRIMARLLTPIRPGLAGEIKAGIFLDTVDRKIAPAATHKGLPDLTLTRIADLIAERATTSA